MHTFFKRKLSIIGLTFLLMFIIEVSLFVIIYKSFFARTFIMELGLMVLLLAPAFLFRSNKGTIAYCSIWILASLSLYLLNVTLNEYSRDIFSMAYIASAREAAKIFDVAYINALAIGGFLLFLALYILGIFGIYKIFKGENDSKNVRYLPKGSIITLALSCSAFLFKYNISSNFL